MQRKKIIFGFILFVHFIAFSQTNEIHIDAELLLETHQIKIEQEIIYHNKSHVELDTIYLLNWANGYKDRHTPLSERLIENYDKNLYFAKIDKRGFSKIQSLELNDRSTTWMELEHAEDIVKIILNQPLKQKGSQR